MNKILSWCHDSATIAVARTLYAAGVAIETAGQCADFLTAIGAQAMVPPKYVGVYTFVIGAIVEAARRRSLKKV